jgi:hypothetical protein
MLNSCVASMDISDLHGVPWFWHYNLWVLTGSSKMKTEWTFLIAPICKSRCKAQTITMHTYIDSAHLGPGHHRHPESHVTVGLVVPFLCVIT